MASAASNNRLAARSNVCRRAILARAQKPVEKPRGPEHDKLGHCATVTNYRNESLLGRQACLAIAWEFIGYGQPPGNVPPLPRSIELIQRINAIWICVPNGIVRYRDLSAKSHGRLATGPRHH